jgi:hypothetical protein
MTSTEVTGFNSKPSTHTFNGQVDFVILLLKFHVYSTHSYTTVTTKQKPEEVNIGFLSLEETDTSMSYHEYRTVSSESARSSGHLKILS